MPQPHESEDLDAFERALGSLYRLSAVGAAGGGVEYVFLEDFAVRVEYLHVNLGSGGGNGNTSAVFNPAAKTVILNPNPGNREPFNVVRAAINYKLNLFQPAAPVVARY